MDESVKKSGFVEMEQDGDLNVHRAQLIFKKPDDSVSDKDVFEEGLGLWYQDTGKWDKMCLQLDVYTNPCMELTKKSDACKPQNYETVKTVIISEIDGYGSDGYKVWIKQIIDEMEIRNVPFSTPAFIDVFGMVKTDDLPKRWFAVDPVPFDEPDDMK
jgi:hypothetical protein